MMALGECMKKMLLVSMFVLGVAACPKPLADDVVVPVAAQPAQETVTQPAAVAADAGVTEVVEVDPASVEATPTTDVGQSQ